MIAVRNKKSFVLKREYFRIEILDFSREEKVMRNNKA